MDIQLRERVCVLFVAGVVAAAGYAQGPDEANSVIRLIDPLDEPEYYCVDIAGWGASLQIDDPLQTHTCKGNGADDQLFRFEGGRIRASQYNGCLHAAGSSDSTLPGSAVLVRPCADVAMQRFVLTQSGELQIQDTAYCLAAGSDSEPASGPSHLWRTLSVEVCDEVVPSRVRWQLGL